MIGYCFCLAIVSAGLSVKLAVFQRNRSIILRFLTSPLYEAALFLQYHRRLNFDFCD
jgi:hypothetical protein